MRKNAAETPVRQQFEDKDGDRLWRHRRTPFATTNVFLAAAAAALAPNGAYFGLVASVPGLPADDAATESKDDWGIRGRIFLDACRRGRDRTFAAAFR